MNLNEITMPAKAARQAFLEYRQSVRAAGGERIAREDAAIMKGYREIVRGHAVINIREVLVAGGFDEQRRPRLAICRADARTCAVSVHFDGDVFFNADHDPSSWATARYKNDRRVFRQLVTWPGPSFQRVQAGAIVPVVPPALRPGHHLRNFDILWEADWRPAVAPRDPALLKHLGGDLYAVLAQWDLTDLERAVIAGTRRRQS